MREKKKKYEIFHAKECNVSEIIKFIKEHYNEKHVFVKNEKLFRWQYVDEDNCNFILARNMKDGTIDAVLGFIPTSHFDKKLKKLKIGELYGRLKMVLHLVWE